MKKKLFFLPKVFLILLIFLAGAASGYAYLKLRPLQQEKKETQEPHIAFLVEVYDKIQENYWEKLTEAQLVDLFIKGVEKITGQPLPPKNETKQELVGNLEKILKNLEKPEEKKEFTTKLADLVLANLKPFGRSRLYTRKEEIALKNQVKNINPEVNQYEVLGVDKEASQAAIQKAYQEQEEKTPEVEQAFKVLADEKSRQVYDESGVEPTIDYKLLKPAIFYLHLKKFSPTTLEELQQVTQKVDDRSEVLDTLIFDLRDNIGGAIDLLPYFLGPFIGKDQYAYQFFHQGEKVDFKTKTGWLESLVRYKKVVVLINENTQSSAEVVASVLKKYNIGVILGTKTRGWGTIEQVFPLTQSIDPEEKHSIFLVHSLTLREDGQPIEGNGIEPLINLNDSGWEDQLYRYYHYDELNQALRELL